MGANPLVLAAGSYWLAWCHCISSQSGWVRRCLHLVRAGCAFLLQALGLWKDSVRKKAWSAERQSWELNLTLMDFSRVPELHSTW